MDEAQQDLKDRVLRAADELFYAHGIQAVGMDRIRDAAGVSLKTLYRCYGSKGALVEAYLRARDRRSRAALAEYAAAFPTPKDQILAIYDWVYEWCTDASYRGCAFINAFGELGAESEAVAQAVRDHKAAVREFFVGLVRATGDPAPEELADQLVILLDGAMTGSAVARTPGPARQARNAADALLTARAACL